MHAIIRFLGLTLLTSLVLPVVFAQEADGAGAAEGEGSSAPAGPSCKSCETLTLDQLEGSAATFEWFLSSTIGSPLDAERQARYEAILAAEMVDSSGRKADPAMPYQHSKPIGESPETKCGNLTNFGLARDGRLLLCDAGNRQIKVVSKDDELLATWQLSASPHAITEGPNGHFYVGCGSEVLMLDATGKEVAKALIPAGVAEPIQAKAVPVATDADAEQQVAEVEAAEVEAVSVVEMVPEEKEPEAEAAQVVEIEIDGQEIEVELVVEEEPPVVVQQTMSGGPCTSIACSDTEVFVGARIVGGYAVIVFDQQLQNGEVLISGQRGCCGQFDICVQDGEIIIAANTRHQVHRYNRQGEQIGAFGHRSRGDKIGFGGCCDPMNVTVSPNGMVVTSESETGLIKTFNREGEIQEMLAVVDKGSGCTRVQVAMTEDAEHIFVVDTRLNLVHRMDRQAAATEGDEAVQK